MTTENYINFLTKSSLDWISITDHNSSANVRNYKKIIEENSCIKVIPGIEVQSIEEVHILVYFKHTHECEEFGKIIEESLIIKSYNQEKLGYQILTDESGEFSEIIDSPYLGSSSSYSVDEIFSIAKKYSTVVVPAHIFRANGLITQLGIPPKINFDAVEVKSEKEMEKARKLGYSSFIFGCDSHFPQQLENISCYIEADSRNFENFKNSLNSEKVIPVWQP